MDSLGKQERAQVYLTSVSWGHLAKKDSDHEMRGWGGGGGGTGCQVPSSTSCRSGRSRQGAGDWGMGGQGAPRVSCRESEGVCLTPPT